MKIEKQPLVSVIMPAYNAENYIAEAVMSIVHQTYENWELLIVEDCSTDGTREVLKTFQDPRIHIYYHDTNQGIARTTNEAIQRSRGTYLALLDDDDIAMEDRLEKQLQYMEAHPEVDILGGRTQYMDQNGTITGYSEIPKQNPRYNKAMLLFGGVSFSNSTAMFRKAFLHIHGIVYQDQCFGMQDVQFYMECSKVGNISAIEDFLLKYRFHPDNETTRSMTELSHKRAERFAEMQRWSLKESGFHLSEEEMALVNKLVTEAGSPCHSSEEFKRFLATMKKIYLQSVEMDMDCSKELNHVLRVKIGNQIRMYDIFFDLY